MWCSCSPWCVTGNMSKYPKCICFFLLFFFLQTRSVLVEFLTASQPQQCCSCVVRMDPPERNCLFQPVVPYEQQVRKKEKTKLHIEGLQGEGCFCLSCLVSSLASWGSVKCHLVSNHLLLCARVICVRVEALDRSTVWQRIQVKLEHPCSASILKTWSCVWFRNI